MDMMEKIDNKIRMERGDPYDLIGLIARLMYLLGGYDLICMLFLGLLLGWLHFTILQRNTSL